MREILLVFILLVSSAMGAVKPFSLPWMNSPNLETYYSLDYPGAVFVMEAYFKNCPYCVDNAPNVDALAEHYKSNPRVQILDVGVDRKDQDYESWIGQHRPNHPVLKDAKREVISQLGTSGFPSTYVLDCNGNVKATTTGLWNSSKIQQIRNAVDQLLTQTCYPMPSRTR